MSSKGYAGYLKSKIMEKSKVFENSLLSASYENIGEAKRIGGIRDALVAIANSIDGTLEEYHKDFLNSQNDLDIDGK